jgi:hypothetical protein
MCGADQAKLKSFAELLRNSVDRNQDGFISKNEFVTGYCIWKVYMCLSHGRREHERVQREEEGGGGRREEGT